MSRMVLLALVAACGISLAFAIQHFRRETPVDTKTALAAPAASKPASDARDRDPAAAAAAPTIANAVTLAGPAIPRDSDNGVPAFDIARIEPTGEAVIADRAQQWNCYATASCMNARSRINPDNSLWSRPDFPQALTI